RCRRARAGALRPHPQPRHPGRRPAQGAGRRHHAGGSAPRDPLRLMGAFEYTAVDPGGKERRGILEGDTARQVRQQLRERHLLPLTVTEVARKEATRQRSFSFSRSMSANDLSLVTRQLATLVQSGLPLEESLLAVSQQTEVPRV